MDPRHDDLRQMENDMTTFVWTSANSVQACRDLGFFVREGRGKDRYYIQFRENPFLPSNELHRVPEEFVESVTIRRTVESQMKLGYYRLGVDGRETVKMLASPYSESRRQQQGHFPVNVTVEIPNKRDVDISAPTLKQALRIFKHADEEQIKPSEEYTSDLIQKFG